MGGRLLSLDLSSNIGWAKFDRPGQPPRFGTLPYGKTEDEIGTEHIARMCGQFSNWLDDLYTVDPWDAIAWEAPFLAPHDKVGKIKILIGLVGICFAFAGSLRHPMRYLEVEPKEVKKRMTGRQDAKKPDVIAACWSLGWKVKSDHEADACGVGLIAYRRIWPKPKTNNPQPEASPRAATADGIERG
jgi:Holliday junction resolvasome RuvABC endonuclease subunit